MLMLGHSSGTLSTCTVFGTHHPYGVLRASSASNLILPFLGDEVDRTAVMVIFRQLVKGVQYIHSQALLHRDLKVC